ncbi:Uncharacterised protein [Klebsiella pneumoniae]|nr:Uncharacterised protein [Klebsiella pneumoniae]SVT00921.1 Uncharacterised protein [Klebsiella pneumoniae]SWS59640.1 Uncharacterised protein [Klebsiella pneumoniae]SWS71550.1 Uncharacterised protein [Klebsiella pneumoniae]SWT04494.1 Uncharacterised protein [Klebsiella pneumoniae]
MINMTLRHFFQLNAAIQQAAFNIFHIFCAVTTCFTR